MSSVTPNETCYTAIFFDSEQKFVHEPHTDQHGTTTCVRCAKKVVG